MACLIPLEQILVNWSTVSFKQERLFPVISVSNMFIPVGGYPVWEFYFYPFKVFVVKKVKGAIHTSSTVRKQLEVVTSACLRQQSESARVNPEVTRRLTCSNLNNFQSVTKYLLTRKKY